VVILEVVVILLSIGADGMVIKAVSGKVQIAGYLCVHCVLVVDDLKSPGRLLNAFR